MPTTVTDPFGNTFETCSISTQLKASMEKKHFSSEAAWAKSVKANAWTVVRMKIQNGEIKKNTIIARAPGGKRLTYKGGDELHLITNGTKGPAVHHLSSFDGQAAFDLNDWDFGPNMVQLAKEQQQIVNSLPKLKKWVTDGGGDIDDVIATVEYPEGVYKVRLLDDEFVSILSPGQKGVGDSYPWDGPDIDAFFKGGKVEYKVGQAPASAPPAAGLPVASTSKSVGALTNEDAATMFVKTKDKLAQEAGINIKGASAKLDELVYKTIADQAGYTPVEMKAKVDAYKASGKKLSALKKKVVSQTGNSTKEATEAAIDKATAAIKKEELKPEEVLQVWDDEAVAKAYVKAKDHVVANNDKGWTLYAKNPDFDAKIHQWMQADLGPIKKADADNAIANYIATKQKLSVLKKQMIKKGELNPQADTLKGAKKTADTPGGTTAAKSGDDAVGGSTAEKAAPQETGAGQVGKATEDPSKIAPKHELTAVEKAEIKTYWEGANLPLASSGQKVYDVAKKLANDYGHGDDVLPVLRWVDEYKAEKFGVPNGHLYEKKVLEHLANPTPAYVPPSSSSFGSGYLGGSGSKVGQTFGELAEDSTLFDFISPTEMSSVWNKSAAPWSGIQSSAVRTYTGSAYHEMNNLLRSLGPGKYKKGMTSSTRQTIDALDDAMRPAPQHVKVSRGVGKAQALGLDSLSDIPSMVGKTFVEPGYSSTSVGTSAAFGGNIKLVIEVPQGTPVAWAKPVSQYSSENELILSRGMEYKVLKVEQNGSQYTVHVRAEGVKL